MVINTETGIEIAVTNVDRTESRKIKITTMAMTSPSPPSLSRSSIDWVMKGA